jgi:peptidoglycan L-alanyl-D-glutamate endopeptidase CwlK
MSQFSFGPTSKARLDTVDDRLAAICHLALCKSSIDFMVLEGRRTVERQHELYGQGRTEAELVKVGVNPKLAKPAMQKVTWTLKSNHFTGRAVDLVPYPVDWNDSKKFDAIAKAMFEAAEDLGTPIRWGADWDRDGKPRERGESDSPHFELAAEVV